MQSLVITSWNIRGLGNDIARDNVRHLIKETNTNVLLIQESKCQDWSNNHLSFIWDSSFHSWIAVNAVGFSGGMLMSWDSGLLSLSEKFRSHHILWCRGMIKNHNKPINIANIHGPHKEKDKVSFWMQLRHLVELYNEEAICIMGDFNRIRVKEDKEGCIYQDKDSKRFNSFIEDMGLFEVRGENFTFTWFGPKNKKNKLDRVLINKEWCPEFKWVTKG